MTRLSRLIIVLVIALAPIIAVTEPARADAIGWEWCAVNWSNDNTDCQSVLNGAVGSVTYPNPSWIYFGHNSQYTGAAIDGFTVSHSGVLQWYYTLTGTVWFDGNVTDASPQTFSCPGCVGIKFSNQTNGAQIYQVTITPAATPTPTPVLTSTPLPQQQVCIPANTISTPTPITPRMTPTPYGLFTQVPQGTPTPAATPLPAGVALKTAFTGSLAPWTNYGLAAWGSAAGPDTQSGVAVLPLTSGSTVTTIGAAIALSQAPANALVYIQNNIPRPWRIVADAITTASIPEGYRAYIQVFEWRDGGLGGGSWYLVANQPVSHAWGVITAASQYTDTVHGIALRAVMGMGDIYNPLGFIPVDNAISVNVDNLVIAAGPDYWNSSYYTGLPVCAGANNPTLAAAQTKICPVSKIVVNVFNCTRPADLLNIGGWIEYLWCNVNAYFNFGRDNQDQLAALRDRQTANEPAGSLAEVPASLSVVNASLDTFRARYGNSRARGLDWGSLLTINVDNAIPKSLPVPDTNVSAVDAGCYLGDSPITFSEADRQWACTAVTFIDNSPLPAVLQFLLYVAGGAMVVMYVFNRWIGGGSSSNED